MGVASSPLGVKRLPPPMGGGGDTSSPLGVGMLPPMGGNVRTGYPHGGNLPTPGGWGLVVGNPLTPPCPGGVSGGYQPP